jgi:hypothetical protein
MKSIQPKEARGLVQGVDHLPSKHEALSSNCPNTLSHHLQNIQEKILAQSEVTKKEIKRRELKEV